MKLDTLRITLITGKSFDFQQRDEAAALAAFDRITNNSSVWITFNNVTSLARAHVVSVEIVLAPSS